MVTDLHPMRAGVGAGVVYINVFIPSFTAYVSRSYILALQHPTKSEYYQRYDLCTLL